MTASKNAGSVFGEQSHVGLGVAVASLLVSDASGGIVGAVDSFDRRWSLDGRVDEPEGRHATATTLERVTVPREPGRAPSTGGDATVVSRQVRETDVPVPVPILYY